MLKAFVAFTVPLAALTMKLAVPIKVGVPEMVPLLGDKVRPRGRLPLPSASVQMTASEPPVAISVALYDVPTVPRGSEVVVMVNPPLVEAMVMLKAFVALTVPLAALTMKSAVPLAVGVPKMTPSVDKFSP
jgi:hypothetical protein